MFSKIETIVTGEQVKHGKPAPDIYLEAAQRLGVDPTNCLVFEDALSGAQAGKAAGCFVVAVPDARLEDKGQKFHFVDVVLGDLTEFDYESWKWEQ